MGWDVPCGKDAYRTAEQLWADMRAQNGYMGEMCQLNKYVCFILIDAMGSAAMIGP